MWEKYTSSIFHIKYARNCKSGYIHSQYTGRRSKPDDLPDIAVLLDQYDFLKIKYKSANLTSQNKTSKLEIAFSDSDFHRSAQLDRNTPSYYLFFLSWYSFLPKRCPRLLLRETNPTPRSY